MTIVLIGMPGCGKSTVGQILADKLGYTFIDTDFLIQQQVGMTPKEIVACKGRDYFLELQDLVVTNIKPGETSIISTGGGIIHSATSVEYLKKFGKIIYLLTKYDIIEARMDKTRKLVNSGRGLKELFELRHPLYLEHSDIVIDCDEKCTYDVALEIINVLKN